MYFLYWAISPDSDSFSGQIVYPIKSIIRPNIHAIFVKFFADILKLPITNLGEEGARIPIASSALTPPQGPIFLLLSPIS